jgi:hypothetical protein
MSVDIEQIAPDLAVSLLRTATGGGRGFLGLDPVTQNDALLVREMTARRAQVFRYGDSVVGYAPNPDAPRQAVVATTSADPDVLVGFVSFLRVYRRFTSFTATTTADQPAAKALRAGGFREVARLRDHVYRAGGYRDLHVYFASPEG